MAIENMIAAVNQIYIGMLGQVLRDYRIDFGEAFFIFDDPCFGLA